MEEQRRCMGCMREIGAEVVCPRCGYAEGTQPAGGVVLLPGTILQGRYLLGRVLGQGGFGITYIGYDQRLKVRVAVKELFPGGMVQRATREQTVHPNCQSEQEFVRGRRRFLEEARTLAMFSDEPGIAGINDCFEANGTAYMIMQYIEGISLKEYLAGKGGSLPPEEAVSILRPVMDALRQVHRQGIIHRDISPDNIMITTNGQVKLIDFGAAKQLSNDGKSLSVLLKPGYAPEEQYRTQGKQGPWTDVYGLSATLYRMVTGETPAESLERLAEDRLVIPEWLPDGVYDALRGGLAVRSAERFQSIEELMGALENRTVKKSGGFRPPAEPPSPPKPYRPPSPSAGSKSSMNWSAALVGMLTAVLILGTAAGTYFVVRSMGKGDPEPAAASAPTDAPTAAPTEALTSAPVTAVPEPAVTQAPASAPRPESAYQGNDTVPSNTQPYPHVEEIIDDVEGKAKEIRKLYNYTQENLSSFRVEQSGNEKRYYNSANSLVRADIIRDNRSELYYFDHGDLYFVFCFSGKNENRFYFYDDALFRWIDNNKTTHDNAFYDEQYVEWMNYLLYNKSQLLK